MEDIALEFTVNGKKSVLTVPARMTLLHLLRERLGLTGTKEGCGVGDCGACTVLLDGEAVNACLVLAGSLQGKKVVTIEALSENGPDPLQKAFLEEGAVQCGFCTPGMILSAKALLDKNPSPSREEIRRALAGNLCRCTGYQKIIAAVARAAQSHATS
ncbi:MAG: (2Fe-2S)-binding protein [bacterium]